MSDKPRLISFDICPYVQRARVALEEKGVDYQLELIDLMNKPAWFLAMSPTGRVPVLEVGGHVLFESMVILEYVDEVYGTPLHVGDPIEKAKDRAWMEFSTQFLSAMYKANTATQASDVDEAYMALEGLMVKLEDELAKSDGPYFRGANFRLVDAAFAPVFVRLDVLDRLTGRDAYVGAMRVRRYADALNARPSVQQTLPDGFEDKLHAYMVKKGSVLAA